MTPKRARAVLVVFLLSAAAAGGCTRHDASTPGSVKRDPNVVLAYVSCGLVPSLETAQAQFESENEGKSVRIEAHEPSALLELVRSGSVPDVVICPGDAETGVLEREGYLDRATRQKIGSLRLAIAVRADDPTVVSGCEDLVSASIESVTMPTPGITALGTDGKRSLERAEVWSKIQGKLSLQNSPLESLKRVVEGEADAAIVYDPCLVLGMEDKIAAGAVRIAAPLSSGSERPVGIYIVVHRRSPNALLAQRLIRLLQEEQIRIPAPPSSAEGEAEEAQSP